MNMLRASHIDERAFLATIRNQSRDNTTKLVYADWLEEQGRKEQAQFIRLLVTVPVTLIDGDSDAEQQELRRVLDLRKQLRDRRRLLDRTWLKAVGDPGMVGDVVVDTHHNVPIFGVIVRETKATVIVAQLERRKLPPQDGPYGPRRPILPTSDELAGLITVGDGVRCRIGEQSFTNDREGRLYRFWTGQTEYYSPD